MIEVGADKPVSSNMWHRPRLYWTIVALWLIVIAAGCVYIAVAGLWNGINPLSILSFWALVFAAPAVVGAIKLLKVKKDAELYTLIVIGAIGVGLSPVLLNPFDSARNPWPFVVIFFVNLLMFPLLLLKRKEIKNVAK